MVSGKGQIYHNSYFAFTVRALRLSIEGLAWSSRSFVTRETVPSFYSGTYQRPVVVDVPTSIFKFDQANLAAAGYQSGNP